MAKNYKVLISLLLVLVMLFSAACSSADDDSKSSDDDDKKGSSFFDDKDRDEDEDKDEDKEDEKDSDEDEKDPDEDEKDPDEDEKDPDEDEDENDPVDVVINQDVSIEETVLFDAEGIVVTALEMEEGYSGPEIEIQVENNSDKKVSVNADSVSVNGYLLPYAYFYVDVSAGKKAKDSLCFYEDELEMAGIETIADIQFYIEVTDADSWDEIATSDLITLSTSAAGFEQPVDYSGEVLYEDNGIKVISKGLWDNDLWDGELVFMIENTSGKTVSVYTEDVSVNGYMQSVGIWADLRDGTRTFEGMYLLEQEDTELESIDEVEEIEFTLRIIDEETWDDIDITDPITLTFE